MSASRPWYSGIVIIWRTSFRAGEALRQHRMGGMIPLLVYLLLGAVVLWVINTIAPLAPFVYSLF